MDSIDTKVHLVVRSVGKDDKVHDSVSVCASSIFQEQPIFQSQPRGARLRNQSKTELKSALGGSK